VRLLPGAVAALAAKQHKYVKALIQAGLKDPGSQRTTTVHLKNATMFTLVALLFPSAALRADEGMWLFNRPPRDLLERRYGFTPTDEWLAKLQRASVRFNNGGSGGFVSPDGLVVTNHHIGADSILKLSRKGKDLHHDGFYAATRDSELKCPDLELNVLQEIVDVTETVKSAVKPGLSDAEAEAARSAIVAKIAHESQSQTGLRSDVVTLYKGAEYHLYRYKRYTDVRLVMAPEYAIASYGGDVDNFEFPRFDLDVCFFRVYEDGRPAQTPHYFKWSATGASDGDLVFVTGHPGTTNRLETLAHLKHRRDVTLPYWLQWLRQREALLTQYALLGPEQKRDAQKDLARVANSRKAYTGQYHGLLDPAVLAAKEKLEQEVRDPIERDPDKAKEYGQPWKRLADSLHEVAAIERRYFLLERGDAFESQLFKIARDLVRYADEQPKDDGKRLREYRTTALPSLQIKLFSPAPISVDLERTKLTGSLAFLAEILGGADPLVVKILAGKSPADRAAELIAGTRLLDVSERKRLFEKGKPALAESGDALLRFAARIDPEARKLRRQFAVVEEAHEQAYAAVARATFARHGTAIAPDATFTLRLAFGVVKGYRVDGADLPSATTFAGAFERSAEHHNEEPFRLPARWLDRKAKLDLATPFNFVSTADTIGGNSGSPVVNRAGELVGLNFDRNRHGLVRNFVYTEVQARHVSVHSRAVLEALRKIYDAEALVLELTSSK
jgi:hypothetical protein